MIRTLMIVCLALAGSLASATPELEAMPSFVSIFGSKTGGPRFSSVTIMNYGNTAATGVFVSNSCSGAIMVTNGCYGDIPPGGSCSLQIDFNPAMDYTNIVFCTIDATANGASVSISVQAQAT